MAQAIDRRDFLATTSACGAAGLLAAGCVGPASRAPTTLHKALITGKPSEKGLLDLKAAGFEGVECSAWQATVADATASRKLTEATGLRIHSVLRGWCQFNAADATKAAADVASVETALRAAQAYGADALLLVPCRIGGMPMPKPWEFDIESDPSTCHVTRVVEGDNAPFKAYIEAHNHAIDATRKAVETLIPKAEETGVIIALENVWNNLWVKPEPFAAFVRSFESKWVRVYFDIGNHVKYALPEFWIRELRELIVKCHVKDFKLNPDGHDGKFVDIRDGSVDWPLVRRELTAVGYSGWMTIEGSGELALAERNRRLDLIIAGA